MLLPLLPELVDMRCGAIVDNDDEVVVFIHMRQPRGKHPNRTHTVRVRKYMLRAMIRRMGEHL